MKLPSLKTTPRALALASGAALALAGSLALAQQPPQPGAQPGQARPLPPLHPPVPGMVPGQGMPQGRGQPGRPPMVIGPDGRPHPAPGTRSVPGIPGKPGKPPAQHHRAAEPEEEEHGGEHVCPGHGPEDPPPPINYWRGMLMVNNERAVKPDFLDQLLFRYENPKDHCDTRNTPPPYLASVLNFAVLLYILYRYGKKPLAEALVSRKKEIMAEIDTADRLYEEAEARLDDYEEKLENIEAKLTEVRAEYASQGELEKKHILADAEERRTRMRRDAEFRIEQERKSVRDALLAEAVATATAAAEELIKKQMSRADQDRMAADYLSSVGAAIKQGEARAASTGAQS